MTDTMREALADAMYADFQEWNPSVLHSVTPHGAAYRVNQIKPFHAGWGYGYQAAQADARALVGELVKAMKSNTAQCSKMHHGKKDQSHEDFGRCPPVERCCEALTKAINWLEGK